MWTLQVLALGAPSLTSEGVITTTLNVNTPEEGHRRSDWMNQQDLTSPAYEKHFQYTDCDGEPPRISSTRSPEIVNIKSLGQMA